MLAFPYHYRMLTWSDPKFSQISKLLRGQLTMATHGCTPHNRSTLPPDIRRMTWLGPAMMVRYAVWRSCCSMQNSFTRPNIAQSGSVVLAWSARAKRSNYVRQELCTALAMIRNVIPVSLDETALPDILKSPIAESKSENIR